MADLDPRIEKSLRDTHKKLLDDGALLTTEELESGYGAFRRRFGPEALRALDGQELLHHMHLHGNKDSLVYWLEFKKDDEFPGTRFGSIAGGSAHKFGLFRRKETGRWVTGSGHKETGVDEAEAIEIARRHRDQFLAGVALLERLPENADDAAYLELQRRMSEEAPDVSGLAWGHKYFTLIYPEKLDDFHSEDWQRRHLLRLLQLPPEEKGLYVCAGRLVRLAHELGWPMNHLGSVLTALFRANRGPRRYWRIGSRLGEGGGARDIWPAMREQNYAAIGWDETGDLSKIEAEPTLRSAVKEVLEPIYYPKAPQVASRKAGEMVHFFETVSEDDVVVAQEGDRTRGVGVITGPYYFDQSDPFDAPHRRPVRWVDVKDLQLPVAGEGLRTTFKELKEERNLLALERALTRVPLPPPPKLIKRIPARIQEILRRKGQVILYGPPGTGKTYWAREAARDLTALNAFGGIYQELSPEQRSEVDGEGDRPGLVRVCTFHPAYGYEDFIEGFRPMTTDAGQLSFVQKNGSFKRICADAAEQPGRKFVLIIDEINRGDIPRIFGELLTLLETDKRGVEVALPVSGEAFSVPSNVWVIGTMNTADRSIALLDTALRRRFGFVELLPDSTVFGKATVDGALPLGPWLDALNDRIREHLGRDARNLQVGHAYLLQSGKPVTGWPGFVNILAQDVVPLLQEYCYEDFSALVKLLGADMIDEPRQRIREELFAPSQRQELIQALFAAAPEIGTSEEAQPEADPEDEEADEQDGE